MYRQSNDIKMSSKGKLMTNYWQVWTNCNLPLEILEILPESWWKLCLVTMIFMNLENVSDFFAAGSPVEYLFLYVCSGDSSKSGNWVPNAAETHLNDIRDISMQYFDKVNDSVFSASSSFKMPKISAASQTIWLRAVSYILAIISSLVTSWSRKLSILT